MPTPTSASTAALASPEPCLWLSPEGHVVETTPEAAALLCVPQELLRTWSVRDLAPSLDEGTWAARCVDARAHGAVHFHATLSCRCLGALESGLVLVRDAQGGAERFCLVFGAAAHAESDRRLREVIANIDGFVMSMGLDGRIAYAEGNFARYGFSPDDVVGRLIDEFIHPDDSPRLRQARALRMEGKGPASIDFRFVAPTGGVHHMRLTSQPRTENGEVTGFLGVFSDLSEQREIEAQLRQAKKQEALGRVTGGVAHDFNNLLTVIALNTELALQLAKVGEPHHEELAEVQRAVQSARSLTQQLLAFGRRQVLRPAAVDVNELVGGLESMLRRVIGGDVVIDFRPCTGTPLAYADPSQLEQLVMSLALHARDAMPRGGRLSLATEGVTVDQARAFSTGTSLEPGEYVLLVVADSGESLSEESRERLFEPFYSSRGAARSSGIGLASVYGIVKQSGGAIEVTSVPGVGTSFHVYLPRPAAAPELEPLRSTAPGPRAPRVLVVEDDASVRRLVTRLLAEAGFDVVEAARPSEALAAFACAPEAVELLVADVVMPEVDGISLADRLRARRPDLPVLHLSGYASTRTHEAATGYELLEKPFAAEALLAAVRRLAPRARASAA